MDYIIAAQHFKAYPKETVEFKETILT
jgi:hypothetical protein